MEVGKYSIRLLFVGSLCTTNSFFSNFSYLSNLGSLSLIVNFDSEETEQMLIKFYEYIEEVDYIQPDIYGLCSLGILLNYLSKVDKNRFKEYSEEFNTDFSDVILEASQAMEKKLEYDTFTGLVCTLNFFILTGQKENSIIVTDMLVRVTEQLYQENELDNLGLAHGVCGIIAVLAKAVLFLEKSEIKSNILEKYKVTLERITNHVIKQKGKIGNFCFPYTIGGKTSRLAWCYGDFSICIALTWAALVLSNKKEIDEVVKYTIDNAINIKDEDRLFITNKETEEFDLALCHGISGVYLVFKRLYEFYPSEKLQGEIERLKQLLEREIKKGIENIIFPVAIQQEPLIFEWQSELTFLNGLSGFLAAYHDDELVKGWDAPLLLDF